MRTTTFTQELRGLSLMPLPSLRVVGCLFFLHLLVYVDTVLVDLMYIFRLGLGYLFACTVSYVVTLTLRRTISTF